MAKAKFSVAFDAGAGGFGPYVVVRGKGGPVVRRRPTYKRHAAPAQLAQEARLRAVAAAWSTLGAAEARAWAAYAATIEKRDPVTGTAYSPSGYNAFSGLALRLLQADPSATVPPLPPVGGFTGDGIIVGCGSATGALTFSASGPNAAGVVTELLAQRLVNVRRSPTGQYKSLAFHGFVAGGLSADVAVEPGTYACAYRFVESATGRATLLQALGVVTVA